MTTHLSRRMLITRALLVGAIAPFADAVLLRPALADLPSVDPGDPMAKALQYVTVSIKPGFECSNCQQYHGKAGDRLGPCAIFPGKQVAASGWCLSWGKRPA
jgi:hypothetical protein